MKTIHLVLWIFVWYLGTALSNIQLKQFLQNNNIFFGGLGSLFISMVLLPFFQPKYQLIDEKQEDSKYSSYKPFIQLSIFNLCNALFTCYAFKYSSIQFNYTIKAFEPFINGVLSMYLLQSHLNTKQWLSLLPIPLGVGLATVTDTSFNWSALFISLSGVYVTCCRSVLFKKSNLPPLHAFIILSGLSGYYCLILLVIYGLLFEFTFPTNIDLFHLIQTSIYYFVYNLASFMILNELHAVSHAIANVMKRIVAILYAWIYFQYPLNSLNILGISIAYGAVCLYGYYKPVNEKRRENAAGKSLKAYLTYVALFLLVIVFLLQGYQLKRVQHTLPLVYKAHPQRIIDRQHCLQNVHSAYITRMKKIIPQHQQIILMDTPDHDNLGDAFIWLGEEMAISMMGMTIYRSCTSTICRHHHRELEITKNHTILMHGGGNFGDVYRWAPELRSLILMNYPENVIVIMPQSIYYQNASNLQMDAMDYAQYPNVHIIARSNQSMTILEQEFADNEHRYLLPDSAFMIGHVAPLCEATRDVLFLKRRDPESILTDHPAYVKMLTDSGLTFDIMDWADIPVVEAAGNAWFNGVPPNQARQPRYRLDEANRLFCRYRVILTDRLHATVLALLMDKPVVCLENNYGKIRGVTNLLEYFGGNTCRSDILRRYYTPNHDMRLAMKQIHQYLRELDDAS